MSLGNILLIVDSETTFKPLEDTLRSLGHAVSVARNGHEGIDLIRTKEFSVVITGPVLSDINTRELIFQLRNISPDTVVIIVGDDESRNNSQEFFSLGVYEYISEPPDPEKVRFIANRAVEFHILLVSNRKLIKGMEEQKVVLQKQNALLARRIEESTKNLVRLYEDLHQTYMRTITSFAEAIDAKDHYTHKHSENVTKYAIVIAQQMLIPQKEVELIREACQLHDLGKIGIPDSILAKPGSLSKEEMELVKLHALKGAQILEPLAFLDGAIDLVKYHHERFDGKGYPDGLLAQDIPLGARIIQLADAYDAMTSSRPYRAVPLTKEQAIEEIKKNSGVQFDPQVVDMFLKVVDRF